MRDLTDKQELFCQFYVGEAAFNATRAAELAEYSGSYATLRSIGSQNLTKPHVRARIQSLMDDLIMSSQEVAARLGAMARGERPTRRTKRGDDETEIFDEQSALELLGKYHSLFIERHEITGSEGGPVELKDIEKAREQRWREIRESLEESGGDTFETID